MLTDLHAELQLISADDVRAIREEVAPLHPVAQAACTTTDGKIVTFDVSAAEALAIIDAELLRRAERSS